MSHVELSTCEQRKWDPMVLYCIQGADEHKDLLGNRNRKKAIRTEKGDKYIFRNQRLQRLRKVLATPLRH